MKQERPDETIKFFLVFGRNGVDAFISIENDVIQTIGVAHGSVFLQIYTNMPKLT